MPSASFITPHSPKGLGDELFWINGLRCTCSSPYNPAASPAPHCGQDDRTGGGASAGQTAESDGGLSALETGEEEDRKTLRRGEVLARVPTLPAAGTLADPRRSLSDGVATQLEAAGHSAHGSGIGGNRATGVFGDGKPRREKAPLLSQTGRPLSTERNQARLLSGNGSKDSFVNTLLVV